VSNSECTKISPSVNLTIRASLKASGTDVTDSSVEVAEDLAKPTKVDHQSQQNGVCPFADQAPNGESKESTVVSNKTVGQNPKYTPLELNPRFTPYSCQDQARSSDMNHDCFQRPAPPVRFNAPAVVATPVPNPVLQHTQSVGPRLRQVESSHSAMPRSASFSSSVNNRWTPDLADVPAKITPQKRHSTPDNSKTSENGNKRPKLERRDDFDLDKQTEKLIHEEIQRGERARQLSNNGNGQGATAEYEKIRKLSNQRNEIRSQLRGQPYRPSATQNTVFSSSRDRRPSAGGAQQLRCLPQDSPLTNVINSASLHEEIVQAKLKFNLVQNQLNDEKARRGAASSTTLARLKLLNETLAALNKRRGEIRNDAGRMDSFRRWDPKEYGGGAGDSTKTTPKSPSVSETDSEWKNRLTLCYEALKRRQPRRGVVNDVKSGSATLSAEEEAFTKQEMSDEHGLPEVEGAEFRVLGIPPRRQVRFALTDVETFL